jgi:GMP synthase (glutamine-hydrolysing)
VHLATSRKYPHQAFRYQDQVWAIQFHLEIDHNLLADCRAVIEKELQESQITDTTMEQLLTEAALHSPAVAPLAEQFIRQFLQLVNKPPYIPAFPNL